MLVYDLTNRGKKSKYEYLYQCLKEDILSGKLAEGEKMPSKRRLSEAPEGRDKRSLSGTG